MASIWDGLGKKIWELSQEDKKKAAPTTTTPAPVAAAPPVNTGTSSSGSGTTNWGSLISNDPLYGQMKAQFGAESVADLASRNAAINRDFVRAGFGLGDLNGLDPSLKNVISGTSVETAANNKFSVAQRIADAFKEQQTSDRVSLRQRGGVRSGEQGYLAQKTLTGAETSKYDALNQLLDGILGYNTQYVGSERNRQQGLWQAMMSAPQRQIDLNGNTQQGTSQSGTGASGPPTSQTYSGAGINPGYAGRYVGELFKINGQLRQWDGRSWVPFTGSVTPGGF